MLKWSTKYHDGTAPSEFKQLSPEDREFLEGALQEFFGQIENPNDIMKEAISKMGDESESVVTTALEMIDCCCDYPDCPRNLAIFNGVEPMLALLEHKNEEIACRSAELLAVMLAHNLSVQAAAGAPAIEKLFKFFHRDGPCRFQALAALGSVIRHDEKLEQEFVKMEGVALLCSCFAQDVSEREKAKAISLMRHLIAEERITEVQDIVASAKALAGAGIGNVSLGELIANLLVELKRVGGDSATIKAIAEERMALVTGAADVEVEMDLLKSI